MFITVLALMASTPATVIGNLPMMNVLPAVARRSHDGIEYLTATISAEGAVVDCHAKLSDDSPFQDVHNCHDFAKVRFQPARDGKGQPIASIMTIALQWHSLTSLRDQVVDAPAADMAAPDSVYLAVNRLPDGTNGMAHADIGFVLDSAGRAEECELKRSSGSPALDRLACASGPAMAHVAVAHGADGQPIRSLRTLRVNFGRQ